MQVTFILIRIFSYKTQLESNYFCFKRSHEQNFFIFLVCLLFTITGSGNDLILQIDSSKGNFKKQSWLGLDAMQIARGDIELHVSHQFHRQHSIHFSGGYDFNFFDTGNQYDSERIVNGYGSGEHTDQVVTLLWGQGPVARLAYQFCYRTHHPWSNYLSLSVMAKSKAYNDYSFLPLSGYTARCESGRQRILGAGLSISARRSWNVVSIHFYGGVGFRNIRNKITWKERTSGNFDPLPEEKFTRSINVPWFEGGIVFLLKISKD